MLAVRSRVALVVAVVVAGCQSLIGIEDSPPLPADSGAGGSAGAGGLGGTAGSDGAAGSDGEAGSDGATDAGCKSARPPTPTAGADPGGAIEFVVAVNEVDTGDRDLADGPSWRKLGYDLDKLCTCEADTAGSCLAPKKVVCDGVDGRDNALGGFLHQIRTVFQVTKLSSDKLSATFKKGGNTVLMRVRGYNGTPNDASVEVAWLSSDDFNVTNMSPPKWDGSDVWPVLAASLVPSPAADGGVQYDADKPKYVDKAAFVANGALVANLPEGAFWFTAQVSIEVVAAVFTAKVEKLGSGAWTLKNGMLSGLTKVSSVLGTLPWVNDPFSDKPICTDNVIYSGIKGMICSYPDMSLLGLPSKPCDHLSMGVAVEGVPAKLGPISVKVKAPSPCTPATDPTTDGC